MAFPYLCVTSCGTSKIITQVVKPALSFSEGELASSNLLELDDSKGQR